MSNIIKMFSDQWVRGLIATLLSLTIIVGFLIGMVPFEFFKDICLMAFVYFFTKRGDTSVVKEEVKSQIKHINE